MTTLAVLGPTASGKSALALALARALRTRGERTEIVAVDAFTVYRGMDIGTDKPTATDQADVAHHLVDILDPSDELTVAEFQRRARSVIADVRARGATPLLVGGSGLYWRAIADDLRFPPTDPMVRGSIERRWNGDVHGAHAELASLDPASGETISAENHRRVIRALEVIQLTGEPFSSFHTAWDRYDSVLPELRVAYLEPPAHVLRARIDERVSRMVDDGLLDEARCLRSKGPLSRTAAQAIGYAEAFAVLDGDASPDGLVPAIATRTWRYAKRQRTWFRADPRCEPVDPDAVLARWPQD